MEQAAPRSPGIYGPTVTFPEPGRNELTLGLEGDQARETFRIPVEVYADEASARKAADAAGEDEPTGAVPFLKEQQWKVGLVTQPVARHDLVERLVVPGETLPAAGAKAVVTPPVAGRLLPPPGGKFPRVGDAVEAGQVVAVVEPPLSGPQGVQFLANQAQIRTLRVELQARLMDIEVETRKAEIDLEHARSVYERTKALAGSDAISRKQLAQDEHDFRIAEAAHAGEAAAQGAVRADPQDGGDHARGDRSRGGGGRFVGINRVVALAGGADPAEGPARRERHRRPGGRG